MPVIAVATADILKSKNLELGWYSWIVTAVNGPKTNAKGDGVNYEVVINLIDWTPEMDGKEIKKTFSSKAIGMILPLYAACKGIPLQQLLDDPKPFQLDTDDLMNKKVDGKAIVENYEGRFINKVDEFAIYKSLAGAAPKF